MQQIVSNSTVRRASATINFYVDTPTDCYYSEGLGSTSGNLINTTLQDCIGQSHASCTMSSSSPTEPVIP